MRKISLIGTMLLLAGSLSTSAQQTLTPAEIGTLKEKTAASAKSLQSLESNFTQTKHLSYLDNAPQSSGKLYFKAPRNIRWEYTRPTPFTVVFTGDKMYTRDERGKTSQTDLAANRRFSALNNLLTQTAQEGDFFDESQFSITYTKNSDGYTAVLVPKEKALGKYIKQIELTIDPTSFLVKQVKIVDPSTDYTQLDFTNQQKNTAVSEDKFVVK